LHQDVTSEEPWKAVIARTVDTYGRLDVLLNNAGIAVLKRIDDMSLADWHRQIEVNLTRLFLGCKYAIPAMRASGGGRLLNISSVLGMVRIPPCVADGAAQGGVRIMSKPVAVGVAADTIRGNTVRAGVIWTNMQAQATA